MHRQPEPLPLHHTWPWEGQEEEKGKGEAQVVEDLPNKPEFKPQYRKKEKEAPV
jgi:hypothetical protein